MTISVVLPAYKEAENLRSILPAIHAALRDLEHEILVIDTMQPMDDAAEVCRRNNAVCIPRAGGNFYGDAIRTGFAEASGKYIVIMDADGSHDPAEIVKFYAEMSAGKYDLIIGSRYCRGGYTDNPAILRLMSRVLNLTYQLLFRLRVRDVSDSFRMYKAEQIKSVELECENFDIVEEILIKLDMAFRPFRIKEVPISFNKRAAGESKRDLVRFIRSYLVTIRRLMRIRKQAARKR